MGPTTTTNNRLWRIFGVTLGAQGRETPLPKMRPIQGTWRTLGKTSITKSPTPSPVENLQQKPKISQKETPALADDVNKFLAFVNFIFELHFEMALFKLIVTFVNFMFELQ